jgi:hypothetical protein
MADLPAFEKFDRMFASFLSVLPDSKADLILSRMSDTNDSRLQALATLSGATGVCGQPALSSDDHRDQEAHHHGEQQHHGDRQNLKEQQRQCEVREEWLVHNSTN